MFSDSDSLSQNSHIVYEILNDDRDILHPKCQAFEVHQMGLHTSAINCSEYCRTNANNYANVELLMFLFFSLQSYISPALDLSATVHIV